MSQARPPVDPDADDPYQNPEVRAAMAAAGVVHRPGLAAEMMIRFAPGLAELGIDLDNLGDTTVEELDAALQVVTEKYNRSLMTPNRKYQALALDVLRDVAYATEYGDDRTARAILHEVQPEETDATPAISHVIGVGLGLLDDWYATPGLRPLLESVSLAPWRAQSRAAAHAVIRAAMIGRALASDRDLVMRYRGLYLFEGTALAVAASIIAIAEGLEVSLEHTAEHFLTADHVGTAPPVGRPPTPATPRSPQGNVVTGKLPRRDNRKRGVSGNPAKRNEASRDEVHARDFAAWLRQQPTTAAPTVGEEVELFASLLTLARANDLNLTSPSGFERLVDEFAMVDEADGRSAAQAALETLDDYVHFRMDTASEADWYEAHRSVEIALEDYDPMEPVLQAIASVGDEVDPVERQAACAATLVVSGVRPLLSWIEPSRRVTPSGNLRRADLAEAAAFLGLSVVGVARYPGGLPADDQHLDVPGGSTDPTPARNMRDIPVLAAWWDALRAAEILATTPSRVRLGHAVAAWVDSTLPPLELTEKVVGMYVVEVLLSEYRRGGLYEDEVTVFTVARLITMMQPGVHPASDELNDLRAALARPANYLLDQLVAVGIAQTDGQGEYTIAPALHAAVARGLLVYSGMRQMMQYD